MVEGAFKGEGLAQSITRVQPLAPPMQVSVRHARASDAASIARIQVATWRTSYRGIVPQTYLDQLDEAKRAAKWSRILRERDSRTLVAETMAGIVGFVSIGAARDWSGPETGEVWALYVSPEHQRRGVGARLFRAGVDALRAEGRQGLMLWTLEKNAPTRAFYEKQGGVAGATKTVELSGIPVEEVAYVWPLFP